MGFEEWKKERDAKGLGENTESTNNTSNGGFEEWRKERDAKGLGKNTESTNNTSNGGFEEWRNSEEGRAALQRSWERKNFAVTSYNANLRKDMESGTLSEMTYNLANEVFTPEENPFALVTYEKAAENFRMSNAVAARLEEAQAEREKALSYDSVAGQAEIDDLEKTFSNATDLAKRIADNQGWIDNYNAGVYDGQYENREMLDNEYSQRKAAYDSDVNEYDGLISQYDNGLEGMKSALEAKKQYHDSAIYAQEYKKWVDDVRLEGDFNNYSKSGAADTLSENSVISMFGLDWQRNEKGKYEAAEWGDKYKLMTDSEREAYNYYYSKYGEKKAKEYLKVIENALNERQAGKAAAAHNNTAIEPFYRIARGYEGVVEGFTGVYDAVVGNEEKRPTSALNYASGKMAQDNTGVFKVVNDAAEAITGMAPTIAASLVNPALGIAVQGLSSGGNAYNEMIERGGNVWQARGKALLVTVSEATLQRFMGGISKLGGKGVSTAAKTIMPGTAAKISSVINSVAAKSPKILSLLGHVVKEMGKEGAEEALQTVLEPLFESFVTRKAYEAPEFEEVVYSGLLGAITSFALEGAPSLVSATPDAVRSVAKGAYNMATGNNAMTKFWVDKLTPKNEVEASLIKDPETAKIIAEIEAEEKARTDIRPESRTAINQNTSEAPKVRAKDVFERGGMLPTADQEIAQTKAASAKTETARTGYLSGATDAQIYIAEMLSNVTGRDIIFAGDDYVADGEFDGDNTIIVNAKRGNIVSQVIAHELAHSVQGTEGYSTLMKAVKAYVDTYSGKGVVADWDTLYSEVYAEYEKKYPEITGKKFDDAKAEREVVSRVIETFFGEGADTTERQVDLTSFIVEYAKADRNGATRMWYKLTKIATRIAEDLADFAKRRVWGKDYDSTYREHQLMLRKIEDIRDMFGNALMEAKKTGVKGERAFDIVALADGKIYVEASRNVVTGKTVDQKRKNITDFFKQLLGGKLSLDIKTLEGDILTLTSAQTADKARAKTKEVNGNKIEMSENEFAVKLSVEAHIDEIAEISKRIGNGPPTTDKKNRVFSKDGFTYRKAYFRDFDGQYYEITLSVGHNGTVATVYNVGKIKQDTLPAATIIAVVGSQPLGKVSLDKSISPTTQKSNKQTVNNTPGKSLSITKSNTAPQNKVEAENRANALSMYEDMRKAQRAQMPTDITEEGIYEQTGWYYDYFGNFVIDREAPVYTDEKTPSEKHRNVLEAQNAELRSENISLAEDAAKWKARAEAAEKAVRIIERDISGRIAADRQLSPEYVPSTKQAEGIISEISESMGGGHTKKQIKEFGARLVNIYDKISTNARYAHELTNYSKEIAELISDMQDVRIEISDNAETAKTLRAELKTPLYLSEKARGDFGSRGGYGKMMRQYRGKVMLTTKERGTPVDVRYGELSSAYPEWFPADIVNEADQLNKILEAADRISDKDFTSRDRYDALDSDPEAVRTSDFDKAMLRILEGYTKLERVPRTFADKIMRQLEYERRENQRELARATEEERERLTEAHEAEMERLMKEAEDAMEWETRYLQKEISQICSEIREAERKAASEAESAREAARKRAHERGADIQDAAIKASQADGSFTKKMTELYNRLNALEDEIARVQAECRNHEHIDTETLRNSDERAYIKQLRARRDALIEDKSNLEAYINKVNSRVKDIRFQAICDMIAEDGYLRGWDDKAAPLWYAVETMRRNVLDIAPKSGDSKLAKYIIEQILDPITEATYYTTVVRNQTRARVDALKLATKPHKGDVLSESQFVQAYAEANDNIDALSKLEGSFIYNKYGEPMREGMTADEWRGYLNRIVEENPGITKDKAKFAHMKESAKVFAEIYDDLFTIVNAARVRNGYAPVPYHRGYFPHYNNVSKQDSVFSALLKGLGLREQEISQKLPTNINGLTATFRPGIRYMSNAKQRSMAGFSGERQITGAVEGLDRYIEVATDVAFQTDNIQNLRALSNAIRYATTNGETKKRVDEIRNNDSFNRDKKQEEINKIFAEKTDKTKYALNNFIVELEEYTNQLAGKKSMRDREWENLFGRSFYTAMKRITSNTAANAITANIGSALTNFIPLMDGGAVMHYHMLGAMWDMMRGIVHGDGFVSTSQFLTNRRGSDRLIKSGKDTASDILGSPMNWVDNFTSELLMRARVRQNMSKHRGGMSFDAAMNEADTFISGMMGDRSKGALPTIYGTANPFLKMFTMYQVEVKNQFGFILKDLPRDSDRLEFIAKVIAMMLLHNLFNDVYEKLVGRRPALDPLNMLKDLGGNLFGWEFESFDELFNGDGDIINKTEKKGVVDSVMSFMTDAASETPFIGGLIGGGRIPISSVMPDWDYLKKAFEGFEGGDSGQKIVENLYKGASPVIYYGALPMAGGAVKKVVEGVNAYAKGGSYTYDAEGNRKLQYPIFTDEGGKSVGTAVKSAVFGKTSTEGGQEWVDSGFGSLSAKQTATYEAMVKAGEGQREAWEGLNAVKNAGSKQIDKVRALLELDLSDKAKLILFRDIITTAEKKIAAAEESVSKPGGIDTYLEQLIDELEGDNIPEVPKEEPQAAKIPVVPKFEPPKVPTVKIPTR